MLCANQGYERLRWSAWPCPQCAGGISPVGHLIRSIDSGAEVSATTPEEIARIQVAKLLGFASNCSHPGVFKALLPRIAEGSEHLVYLDTQSGEVVKITRPGIYGESYYLVNNIVHQKNCSPLEYLLRLRLWKKLFQSAPTPVGITGAGQLVSRHRFVTGDPPTQDSVNFFLEKIGFAAVRKNFWLWKKEYPDELYWLGDARAENFVETVAGIVPIDIRLWQTSPPI